VKGHCRIGPVRAIDLPANGSGKMVSAPAGLDLAGPACVRTRILPAAARQIQAVLQNLMQLPTGKAGEQAACRTGSKAARSARYPLVNAAGSTCLSGNG
jgi:hypothetical protein